MLHVEQESVRAAAAEAGETAPIGALLPRLRTEGVRAISPNGVLGDPAGATAEEGAALLDALVDRLVAGAASWRVDTIGRLAA